MARKPKTPSLDLPELPPEPAPSAEKIAQERQILADLEVLVQRLEQRALNTAVALAQQAARGEGPLVQHFMEIGRRYAKLLDAPSKPKLRLVQGGADLLTQGRA